MDTQVEQKQAIEAAIQRGVDSYFAQCHARIPSFIRQHFGWPGAIATNKVAWGWDLLRAPLNLGADLCFSVLNSFFTEEGVS